MLNKSPDAALQGLPKKAPDTAPKPTQESPKQPGRTFKLSEFQKVVGGETERDKKGNIVEKKDKDVFISEETEKKYASFLQGYLKIVDDALKKDPSLRNNPHAKQDIALLDGLDGVKNGVIDSKKLDEFFSQARGWIIATEMINNYASRVEFAIGLKSEINPAGERSYAANGMTLHFGDRGLLNVLWYDKLKPNMRKVSKAIAVVTTGGFSLPMIGAGVGLASGGTLESEAIGAAAVISTEAAVLGGVVAARSLKKGGTEITLSPYIHMFNAIKADAPESAYMRALTGIDFAHLQVNPTTNKIERVATAGVSVESDTNVSELNENVGKFLDLRREFYKAIQVPLKRLDSLPEEALLRRSVAEEGVSFEQLNTTWGQDIIDEFKANAGGIRDIWGQEPGNPNFCISNGPAVGMIVPPTFNPDHLDTVGNVRRFQEARMRIIVRETIAMLSKELVGESSTRIRGAVKDRIKTVADGKDKTIRKKPIEERKAKLEAERKGLDDQTAKIQAYQTKVKEPNTAEQTFRTEFPDQVALGRNIDQAITQTHTNITNLTDEINNRELNATTNAQTIADARIGALPALVTTGNPALDQQNQRERYAKVLQIQTDTSKEYEKHTENLKNKLTELKRQAIKLNELRKHDEEYRKEIREAEDAVIESTGENLDKIKANFDKVTTGWGVPQTELTTKTVDELMASANAVYTTDRTAGVPAATRRGWPASKNNVAANRELLVLAIAEAKAQKAEGDDPNSFTRQPDYLEITGWTITEDQLRSLPENQLKGLLNILYASDVAAGIPAAARRGWNATGNTDPNNTLRLRNAVAESRNRFLLRHTLAVAEKTKDLDAQIVKAAKEIETIDKEPTDKISDALIMTDLLLERQGEVFANSGKLKTQIDTLLNTTTAVGNTDTEYSKTERALKQPKGYYEILNLLFDYQHGIKSTDPELTPDREESFKKISTLLPPARLAKLIDLSFNLGLATAGVPFTIEDVLFQLEGEIKNTRNISYPEIHEGFSNLVTTLGKEAIV